MRKVLLLVYVFLSIPLFSNNLIFDKISTKQGLSQNTINCIFQDSQGMMWFGTNDGLNKYDGYEFKVLRPEKTSYNNLSSLPVISVCEDTSSCLWIAYADDYLDIYDLNTGIVKPIAIEAKERTDIHKVYNFAGHIWLLGENSMYKAKRVGGELSFCRLEISATSLYIHGLIYYNNQVWVSTNQGVRLLEKEGEEKYSVSEKSIGINSRALHSIPYENGLLLSYTKGMYYVDSEDECELIKEGESTQMLIDSKQNLWLNCEKKIYQYSCNNIVDKDFSVGLEIKAGIERNNISSGYISQIFEDRYGNIWIGTFDGGINKMTPGKSSFQYFYSQEEEGAISRNNIQSLYADSRAGLWVGLSNCRIDYRKNSQGDFNKGFKTLTQTDVSLGYKIMGFFEFSYDDKSIICSNHLFARDNHTFELTDKGPVATQLPEKLYEINRPICDLIEDEEFLWIATYGEGLYLFNKNTDELKHYTKKEGLVSNIVRSLLLDSDKNLWIGADRGLQRLSVKEAYDSELIISTFVSNRTKSNTLSHNYILPIIESSTGKLWVGTLGGGINIFLGDSLGFRNIGVSDGLPNNVIKAIIEDSEGYMWASSNDGISRIDTSNWSIQNYDVSDGLQGDEFAEFAACKLGDNQLMFGGVRGFNVFSPQEIKHDSLMPDLVFTQLNILNQKVIPGSQINNNTILTKEIDVCESISLDYEQNSFTVFFAALQYKYPEKVKYKYKLVGFDKDWIETSSKYRFARYTQVKPGKYALKVMVSNSKGEWNENIKTLDITIRPTFVKSKMAYSIYILAIVLLIVLIWRYKIIRYNLKQQLLMVNFEKEKVEELNAVKLKFFTNISHEFRTPLTLINMYLEKMIDSWNSGKKREIGDDLHTAQRNNKVLLNLVNQLMDFRKLEQGKMDIKVSENNIAAFLREIAQAFNVLSENKKITLSVNIGKEEISLWYDPSAMEKIIYNILGNALKYTPTKGLLEVKCVDDVDEVRIIISDSGIGIAKELQQKVFERFYQSGKTDAFNSGSTGIGLSLTKDLVELHKGTISVESEENKGSTFCLIFKKGFKHFNPKDLVNENAESEFDITEASSDFQAIESNQGVGMIHQNRKKILIVEDNEELRLLLKNSFAEEYDILLAENGKVGFKQCKEHLPDVVVSDIMMPEMNGFTLCHHIKNDMDVCHIPLILLTAKTTYESQLSGFEAGADAYVTKPFSIKVLHSQIQSIFKSREKTIRAFKDNRQDDSGEQNLSKLDQKFIEKLNQVVEEYMHDSSFTVQQLAEQCGLSNKVLNKKLQNIYGETALVYVRNKRLKKAEDLLKTKLYTVSEVTYEVGFEDKSYFRKCFKRLYGKNPVELL